MNENGIAFSMDFAVAALASFLILAIFLYSAQAIAETRGREMKEFALKKDAVFFLDSMVKNHCSSPMKCLAFMDLEKKRVKESILDESALAGLSGEAGFAGIESVRLEFKDGETRELFKREAKGKNCYSLNRLVSVRGKKALLELRACGD